VATSQIASLQAMLTDAIADRNVEFDASGVLKTKVASLENELSELRRIKEIPQLLIQYVENQRHDSLTFSNQGPVAVQNISLSYLLMSKYDESDPKTKVENTVEIVPFSGIGLLLPGKEQDNWRFTAKTNRTTSPLKDFLTNFLQYGWQSEFSLTVNYEDMEAHGFSRRFIINRDVYSNILFTAEAAKIRV
jgi:hypothetical protein